MKSVILVGDGMADWPVDALGGRTPLEAAHTPAMDRIAREGTTGLAETVPEGYEPGSEVANLEIMGYDARTSLRGRGAIEASGMGIALGPEDVAFRMNFVTREGPLLLDYSAGHITSDESHQLVDLLQMELGDEIGFRFYPGVGFRHIAVVTGVPDTTITTPPHNIMDQPIGEYVPTGDGAKLVRSVMEHSEPILAASPVNRARRAAGQPEANMIWLWGPGKRLELAPFDKRFGVRGGVIAAVDLIRGIGRAAGLEIVEVPGITGYLDTNYAGKGAYAVRALTEFDFMFVHVEAPDEASHDGHLPEKVRAIERFDLHVVGPIGDALRDQGEFRLLVLPDHPTPLAKRTHVREPVPFALGGTGVKPDGTTAFTEVSARSGAFGSRVGHRLVDLLFERELAHR